MIDIVLNIFAGLGILFILFMLWMIIDEMRSPLIHPTEAPEPLEHSKSFQFVDNSVRGTIQHGRYVRGSMHSAEPTLKGRVDMIEKHLGIQVVVEPAQPEKLVVKKKGTK